MPWFADLTSELSIPAGGAALAAAVYTGCVVAEKEARKEALQDISRAILNYHYSVRSVSAKVVNEIFNYTFGQKHWTLKCIYRSCLASIFILSSIALYSGAIADIFYKIKIDGGIQLLFIEIIPVIFVDYFVLYKSRILLVLAKSNRLPVFLMLTLDFVTSFLLFILGRIIIVAVFLYIIYGVKFVYHINLSPNGYYTALMENFYAYNEGRIKHLPLDVVIFLSIIITSIWSFIFTVSTLGLCALRPLQKFVGWFMPLNERPVRAIGLVAAGLITLSASVWPLVRPIFF